MFVKKIIKYGVIIIPQIRMKSIQVLKIIIVNEWMRGKKIMYDRINGFIFRVISKSVSISRNSIGLNIRHFDYFKCGLFEA